MTISRALRHAARIASVLAATSLVMAGCAHTCQPATFFKPDLEPDAPIKARWNSTSGGLQLHVHDRARIEVYECGMAYKTAEESPSAVCMDILADEGIEISFTSGDFRFLGPDGSDLGTSNPPPSPLVFQGARSGNASYIARKLSASANWKEHFLSIDAPPISTREFILQLPEVRIDGQSMEPLRIRFRLTAGKDCALSV